MEKQKIEYLLDSDLAKIAELSLSCNDVGQLIDIRIEQDRRKNLNNPKKEELLNG
jgi:hypothetical protein